MTDLWSDKQARDNAAGGTREHRAIPQVPLKTGRTGPSDGVPSSCLRERKGGFASFISFPLPPAGTRKKKERAYPCKTLRVRKS